MSSMRSFWEKQTRLSTESKEESVSVRKRASIGSSAGEQVEAHRSSSLCSPRHRHEWEQRMRSAIKNMQGTNKSNLRQIAETLENLKVRGAADEVVEPLLRHCREVQLSLPSSAPTSECSDGEAANGDFGDEDEDEEALMMRLCPQEWITLRATVELMTKSAGILSGLLPNTKASAAASTAASPRHSPPRRAGRAEIAAMPSPLRSPSRVWQASQDVDALAGSPKKGPALPPPPPPPPSRTTPYGASAAAAEGDAGAGAACVGGDAASGLRGVEGRRRSSIEEPAREPDAHLATA